MDISKDTSERIKSIIKEQGYTYEALGREIGVSPQAVSEVVNGRTTGATARYALAKALGHEPYELWPEVEQPKRMSA